MWLKTINKSELCYSCIAPCNALIFHHAARRMASSKGKLQLFYKYIGCNQTQWKIVRRTRQTQRMTNSTMDKISKVHQISATLQNSHAPNCITILMTFFIINTLQFKTEWKIPLRFMPKYWAILCILIRCKGLCWSCGKRNHWTHWNDNWALGHKVNSKGNRRGTFGMGDGT